LESSETCPVDCGTVQNQTEPNATQPPPSPGTTNGGGGGGGGGGGTTPPPSVKTKKICEENWLCSLWGDCTVFSLQYRNCSDINDCGTTLLQPPLVQQCAYTPLCTDGVMNGLETGVDCGGPCPPCPHCYDGVQDMGETDVDCGGPCPACPSCSDGTKNQGETGVDCGGPCKQCKKLFEFPKLICERRIAFWNPYFIGFIGLIVLIISGSIFFFSRKMRKVHVAGDIDVQHAIKAVGIKRRMYLFILTTLIIALILFLYYFFVGTCYELNVQMLWLLLLALVMVPVIIHFVMKIFEFSEQRFINRMRRLHDTHYRQIMDLIGIENRYLMEVEEDIAEHIRLLQNNVAFTEKLKAFPELKKIYKELLMLFDVYKKESTPYGEERVLLDDVHKLAERQDFKTLAQEAAEVNYILEKLKILFKMYGEKQGFYDELERMDHPERFEKGALGADGAAEQVARSGGSQEGGSEVASSDAAKATGVEGASKGDKDAKAEGGVEKKKE
jgi:hypothetical protein